MNQKMKKIFLFTLIIFFLLLGKTVSSSFAQESPTPSPTPTQAPNNDQASKDLLNKIKELESKVADLQGQEKTLSSQIAVMDSQIRLTELKMNSVKQQISDLTNDIATANKKISNLESSLNDLTKVLSRRISATYEVGVVNPFHILLASNNASSYFTRSNYLKLVQEHDKRLIFETQQAKNDYSNQKDIYEDKKKKIEALKTELESFTAQLDQEKKNKKALLDATQNDESKYQDMLARTRAEFQAIQGISAGMGTETEVKSVKEGDQIASIISGASYCSNGTHLHFEVHDGGTTVSPANYLSSKDVNWDLCGWFGCDGPFSFGGSWQWPINGKPIITQGYGMTAYAKSGAYGGGPHTGIDMVSDDLSIKAVKDGILYRGSIACGGGALRYVKVKHNDSNIESYYLHVNYIF